MTIQGHAGTDTATDPDAPPTSRLFVAVSLGAISDDDIDGLEVEVFPTLHFVKLAPAHQQQQI